MISAYLEIENRHSKPSSRRIKAVIPAYAGIQLFAEFSQKVDDSLFAS
jgi:hypothetical protein